MNREHTLELLTLLTVIAIVQMPVPDLSDHAGIIPVDSPKTTVVAAEQDPDGSPHRLDPLGLLQASVPEHWRIELPTAAPMPRQSLSC